MLSIAIVDDEQVHRDILTKYIEEWKAKERLEAEVETFASGEAFYFAWSGEQRYDVLFLDIMMGATDGISLARRLREQGRKLDIIFTTGIADYMQEGYEVEAMHYLLKPLSKEKVWECLDKCLMRREEDAEWILLPTEEGLVKTDVSKILYGEAVGHYCVLECMGERLQLKLGMKELAKKLEGRGDFLFCHRSYLVNLRRVSKVGRQDIVMEGGALVPVSRRMYNEVNDRFIRAFVGPGLTE
ncbi:LytTR family DNA-binding domain-containing protein [uncultured Acetatifactor sp.]|uniref:LytR/AlgR family response regulator transcription factor n=1 Tax=uncultured Acetatifactor sp. TaxID=1671927 RepID=UPI0026397BD8|nr:LytTR family DNA-binding domain-containing protein [uncultured Acetatifactor sp.]